MGLSSRQRLLLGVVCAIPVVIFIVIMLQPKREVAAVGGACRNHVFCDSGECLQRYAKLNEYGVYEIPVDGSGGVCTAACKDDQACPSTMQCASVIRKALFPGVGASPPDAESKRCVPREWSE